MNQKERDEILKNIFYERIVIPEFDKISVYGSKVINIPRKKLGLTKQQVLETEASIDNDKGSKLAQVIKKLIDFNVPLEKIEWFVIRGGLDRNDAKVAVKLLKENIDCNHKKENLDKAVIPVKPAHEQSFIDKWGGLWFFGLFFGIPLMVILSLFGLYNIAGIIAGLLILIYVSGFVIGMLVDKN